MLNDKNKALVADIIEKEKGYTILDWREINGNVYTPFSRKVKNGKEGVHMMITVHNDTGNVYFWDFTADSDNGFIDLGAKSITTDTLKSDVAKKIEYENNKLREEKFNALYKSIKFCKTNAKHPLFVQKKLKHFSSLYSKKIVVEKDNGDINEYKSCVVVPFKCAKTDKLIGVQFRPRNLSKLSLTYSKLKLGYHVIQEGEYDDNTRIKNVLLCESFTTGSEIAEARPKDMVICTAGISQLISVYWALRKREAFKDCNCIFVLDKLKSGKELSKVDYQLSGFDNRIQLDKHSNATIGLTDFNDYALRYGKEAVKKEIYDQLSFVEVKMPEIISYEDGTFTFVSPVTKTLETVKDAMIIGRLDALMNNATLSVFKEREGIPEEPEPSGETDEPTGEDIKLYNKKLRRSLKNKFLKDYRRVEKTVPRKLGIYKDEASHIANLKGGRFKSGGEEIERTFDIIPNRKHIYIDNSEFPLKDSLKDSILTKEDFDNMKEWWLDLYRSKDPTPFYLMLGYVVQAAYAGISPFRTHLWVTGGTGKGKSILKEGFAYKLNKRVGLKATDVTVAAIDQELGGGGCMNAVCYNIDEAGLAANKKREKDMADIIQVARDLSMNDGTEAKKRGTHDQKENRAFHRTASFMLSSVEHSLKYDQDLARFIIINLEKYGLNLNTDKINGYNKNMDTIVDKYMAAVIKRAHRFVPLHRKLFTKVKNILGSEGWLSHKAMAVTSYMAGLAVIWELVNNLSEGETISEIVEIMEPMILRQKEDHFKALNASVNAIDKILATQLEMNGCSYTLPEYLQGFDDTKERNLVFSLYGIGSKGGDIILRKEKLNLEGFYAQYTRKALNLKISLNELSGLLGIDDRISMTTVRFKKVSYECYRIKV